MSKFGFFFFGTLVVAGINCSKKDTSASISIFESIPVAIEISGDVPNEVSGIADSEKNPGYCWVHQDSNNPPELILLNHEGQVFKKIYLKGASNIDWEDITLGKVPGSTEMQLLIAETGNNDLGRTQYSVYRFPEPSINTDTVGSFQLITFSYPDGPHDTEALLTDSTGDIYLITKRDVHSKVYRLSYPQSLTTINQAQFITDLHYNGVVSAASTGSGKELIIKTYTQLKYYTRAGGQSIAECLQQVPKELTYQLEPMGEAITFSVDGTGFFTLSEKSGPNPVKLYFYRRK